MTESLFPTRGRGAILSPDGVFRFALWRDLETPFDKTALFIGLNPSTADAVQDDPTIRRMMGFARRYGCNRLEVVNLFAFRATDPRDLGVAIHLYEAHTTRGDFAGVPDPTGGEENNREILQRAKAAKTVFACWGAYPGATQRALGVRRLLQEEGVALYHFGLTREGHPRHPLYLRGNTPIWKWDP